MKTRRPSRRPARAPAPARTPGPSFPIVAIGASAGGLEAFSQVLAAVPPKTGAAFVLLQHLDPQHESALASLLARSTTMPVRETTDGTRILPDHVYVIPPTVDIALTDGHIRHVPRGPRREPHTPIDLFLRTLAEVRGRGAIAVILSGTGTDGTQGCRDVKAHGGISLAQDPDSAKFPAMPRSAIDAQCVDFVLPPAAIGEQVGRLAAGPYLRAPPSDDADVTSSPADDEALASVFALLRDATGADFSCYRKTMLLRRIQRRMALHGIDRLPAYAAALATDSAEVAALHRDLLIHVTAFFRDPQTFEFLKTAASARKLLTRAGAAPVRVWVPGCATGEEAYSIAMCLLEVQAELGGHTAIQVFASDLSEGAVQTARLGVYPESIEAQVSAERLRRFFVKDGNSYHVGKAMRAMLVFARHDLTSDPPFSRMDLVSCRNVLIYLEPALQKRVIATFHYALQPGGLLLLGQSETVGSEAAAFEVVDRDHKLYAKRGQAVPTPRRMASVEPPRAGPPRPAPARREGRTDVVRESERVLLRRFAPASVLVDERDEVFHFVGDTEPYLGHAEGAASLQVTKLVRKSLLPDLRELLREARARAAPQRKTGLAVRERGRSHSVAISVVPVQAPGSGERCWLVSFEREESAPARPAARPRSASAERRRIAQLERELKALEHYQQAAQQEHDVARDELQAANEEIVSSNEELQSINEELETAKEELQSNNEELLTLNDELQARNRELQQLHETLKDNQRLAEEARDFAEAIVDAVRAPLVILDRKLCVKRTNDAFCQAFRVTRRGAEGTPFVDVMGPAWAPALAPLLEAVLATGRGLDDHLVEDVASGPRTFVVDARRFRHDEGEAALVLVSIEDRTEFVRAEAERARLLRAAEGAAAEADAANRLKDEFVANASHELRGPLSAMLTWTHLLGVAPADPDVAARGLAAIERSARAQTRLIDDLLDVTRMTLGRLRLDARLQPLQPIVEAAVDAVRPTAGAKGVALTFDGGAGAELVMADPERLQQVVWNLVTNAVKFTPAGGRVQVWCGRVGTLLQVRVEDDGQGIAPTFLPHVFERFRQADGSTSRRQQGLGLGLAIVRQLVELHGGAVSAESAGEGAGATFVVSLPVPAMRAEDPDGEVAPERRRGARADQAPSLDGLRVLVVDDDEDSREAVQVVLQQRGATVAAAASAAAALEAFDAAPPDVLVSDIGMPVQDGYALIRSVRERSSARGGAVPALALTAYAGPEDRRRTAAAGFQEYLSKPAEPTELVWRVATLAGRGSSE